jgi:hypothetical protein
LNAVWVVILHESIVDCDDEDPTGTTKFVTHHVSWDVVVGAARGEGSRDADDETFAGLEFLGEVDLLAWRALEELNARDGVTDFDLQMACG